MDEHNKKGEINKRKDLTISTGFDIIYTENEKRLTLKRRYYDLLESQIDYQRQVPQGRTF